MIFLAAQRKPDGKLVIVSPEEGFEFDVDEDSVELGQFCSIEIENNVPKTIIREETGMEELVVRVKRDLALVSGVVGKLIRRFAYFYETKEFGKVACTDGQPGHEGTEHKIIISRLPEEGRIGMYSKCVWGAVSDGIVCEKEDDEKLKDSNLKVVDTESTSRDISLECDVEPKEDTSYDKTSDEVILKTVSGMITALDRFKIHAFMACSLTFPRVDINIRLSIDKPLKSGDFVEISVTPEQFEKHFPPKPHEQTPRFFTESYRKIATPLGYSVDDRIVTIRKVKLPSGYKQGNNIHDPYLGVISDKYRRIPIGCSTVDIIISRHNVFTTQEGELTSWLVSVANGVRESSEKPPGPSEVPSRFARLLEPKTEKKEESAKKTNNDMSATSSTNRFQRIKSSASPLPDVGFNKDAVNGKELVTKVAVVTSLKPNIKFKGTVAYLWLLEDLKKSIFYLNPDQKLDVGHFFQGEFIQNGDEWECKKYKNPVQKCFDGFVRDDCFECRIQVHDYFPQTAERMLPETYKLFFGNIVDRYKLLPQNCSGGVNIIVRLCKIGAKKEWGWVVIRVLQSRYIQLLTEFNNAWNAPGISYAISLKYPAEYQVLSATFGVQLTSRFLSLLPSKAKVDRNVNVAKKSEEEDENKTYAWVTEHDEDFVRMVLFPRQEGQAVNGLKVDVMDLSKRSAEISTRRLYEVRHDEKGEKMELIDCSQYISADENDHFEFEFASNENDRLAKNVVTAEPVGMPKWLGKLMFIRPERSIPKETTLWKGRFRLLDNQNLLVDCEELSVKGVSFISVGEVEKLIKSELSEKPEPRTKEVEKCDRNQQDVIRAMLLNRSQNDIFKLFKNACSVLRDEKIVEELKKQNVYTTGLQPFQRR